MILIALIVVVTVVVVLILRRRSPALPGTVGRTTPLSATSTKGSKSIPAYVEALLDRWTNAGVLDQARAEKIRAFELEAIEVGQSPAERSRVHAIAEALGYLGGMLGIVGLVVLLADFWSEFTDGARIGVPAGATAALIIAGILVPEAASPAMFRLRTFLWLLATVSSGLMAWVFVDVVFDTSDVRREWLAVGIVTATISGVLWAGRSRPVQQFTALAGAAIAIGTAIGEVASAGFSGIGLWMTGSLLVVSQLRKTGVRASVDQIAGSIATVVGAFLTVADWRGPGLVFVLATGLALIAPASVRRIEIPGPVQLVTGIAGLLALVQGVPMCLAHFAAEAGLVTGLIVWSSGILTAFVTGKSLLKLDLPFQLASGAMLVGGAALTATQYMGFATIFGLVTSIALVAFGARPGHALMSVFGLIGIVVFIPWLISHFFPGEGRVPLLIIVSGLVLVGAAVILTRLGGRLRGEVRLRA